MQKFQNTVPLAVYPKMFQRTVVSYASVISSRFLLKEKNFRVSAKQGVMPIGLSVGPSFYHASVTLHGKIVPFKLSDIGEGIAEVVLKEWFVNVGDRIQQFDNICEVQSDKASVTITSRYDGCVTNLHHDVEDIVRVGMPLVDIELSEEITSEDSSAAIPDITISIPEEVSEVQEESDSRVKVLCTPAVDLSKVSASRPDGRIVKEDIIRYLQEEGLRSKQVLPETKTEKQPVLSPPGGPPPFTTPKDRVEVLTDIRKVMAKTMTCALKVPHFGYCDEIDMSQLTILRSSFGDSLSGTHITFMPFFIKAASLALLAFPSLNAHVDGNCETVTLRGSHNIGVAMDTPQGLLVPNVKNVQDLSISQLNTELQRLRSLATKGKLSPKDVTGGTFTLSNIGSKLPRFDENDVVQAVRIMRVSWSADHRVVDGATVARFSNLWKAYIEQPASMLLHLR